MPSCERITYDDVKFSDKLVAEIVMESEKQERQEAKSYARALASHKSRSEPWWLPLLCNRMNKCHDLLPKRNFSCRIELVSVVQHQSLRTEEGENRWKTVGKKHQHLDRHWDRIPGIQTNKQRRKMAGRESREGERWHPTKAPFTIIQLHALILVPGQSPPPNQDSS